MLSIDCIQHLCTVVQQCSVTRPLVQPVQQGDDAPVFMRKCSAMRPFTVAGLHSEPFLLSPRSFHGTPNCRHPVWFAARSRRCGPSTSSRSCSATRTRFLDVRPSRPTAVHTSQTGDLDAVLLLHPVESLASGLNRPALDPKPAICRTMPHLTLLWPCPDVAETLGPGCVS